MKTPQNPSKKTQNLGTDLLEMENSLFENDPFENMEWHDPLENMEWPDPFKQSCLNRTQNPFKSAQLVQTRHGTRIVLEMIQGSNALGTQIPKTRRVKTELLGTRPRPETWLSKPEPGV